MRALFHILDPNCEQTPVRMWFPIPRGAGMNKKLISKLLTQYFARGGDFEEGDIKDTVSYIMKYATIRYTRNCAHIDDEAQTFVISIV